MKYKKFTVFAALLSAMAITMPEEASAASWNGITGEDSNYYYYDRGIVYNYGYFTNENRGVTFEHRDGKWTDSDPGDTVYLWNKYDVRGDRLIGKAADYGFTNIDSHWEAPMFRNYDTSFNNVEYMREASYDYRRAKTSPEYKITEIWGADYVDGYKYWIKPDSTLTMRVRGYQDYLGNKIQLDDFVKYNYISFQGDGLDTRAWMEYDGSFKYYRTDNEIDIKKGSVSRTVGNRNLYTTFDVTFKGNDRNFDIKTYHKSENGKSVGWNDTGLNIMTDGDAPTVNDPTVYDYRYNNGNDYWVKPGDTIRIKTSATDKGSLMETNYLRLYGDGNDNRAYHAWDDSDGTINEFYPDSYTSITGGTSPYYAQTAMYTFNVKVNTNADGKDFDILQYFKDNVKNTVGYDNSGQNIRVDGTAPTVTASSSSRGWDDSGVNITLNFDDPRSGVATKQYAWTTSTTTPSSWNDYSSSVSQSSSNMWYLHYKTTDNAGNSKTGHFGPYKIDTVNPTGNVSADTTSWTTGDVTLSAIGSDDVSGMKRVKNPDGSYTNGSNSIYKVTSNGTYTFVFEDYAGNTLTRSIKVSNIDKIAPNAPTLTLDESWVDNFRTFKATNNGDTGSGVKELQYKLGSGSWKTYVPNYSSDRVIARNTTGTNKVYVRVIDKVGNVSAVVSGTARVDNTNPSSPTINMSESWTNTDRTFTLSGGSDAHSGVKEVQYKIGSGSWKAYSGGTIVALNSTGEVQVHARTVDKVSNTSSTVSKTARVDETKPVAPTINMSESWTSGNRTFSLSGTSDVGSGVKEVQYKIGNGSWTTYSGGNVTALTSSGEVQVYARTLDNVNNVSSTASKTARVDKTNPITPTINMSENWTSSNRTFSLSGATDAHSGMKVVQYKIGSGSWKTYAGGNVTALNSTGEVKVYARTIDNVNNTSSTTSKTARVDKTNPTAPTLNMSESWIDGDRYFSLSGATDGHSGVKVVQYKLGSGSWKTYTGGNVLARNSSGETNVYARTIDNVNNTSSTVSKVARVDKTNPLAPTINMSEGWTSGNRTFSLSGQSDAHSGVKEVQYKIGNGSWTKYTGGNVTALSATGEVQVYARTVDKVDNISSTTSKTARVDKTKPSTTTINMNENWIDGDRYFSLNSGNDGHSGVKEVQYKIGNGSWKKYTGGNVLALNTSGEVTVHARTIDKVNNISNETSKVARVDKTNPTAPTLNMSENWTSGNRYFTISGGSDAHSGVKEVQYKIGNGSWTKYTGGNVLALNSTGEVTVSTRTVDKVNNTSSIVSKTARVDKTNPVTPTINMSESWTSNDRYFSLSGESDAHSGVAEVQYKIGNGSWTKYTGGNVLALDKSGTIQVYARTVDKVNNISSEASKVAKVDKTNPTAPTINMDESWTNIERTFTLSGASDAHSGVKTVQYKIDDGSWTTYNNNTVSALKANGTVTVYARTIDNVGNISATVSKTAKVDKDDGKLVSKSISGERYKDGTDYWFRPGDTITTKLKATDSLSGIDRIYSRYQGDGNDARAYADKSSAGHFDTWKDIKFTSAELSLDSGKTRELKTVGKIKATNEVYNLNFTYYLRDIAGNTIGYLDTGLDINIDGEKPTQPTLAVSDNTVSQATFTVKPGTDGSGSGVMQTEYRLIGSNAKDWTKYNGEVTLFEEGETTIEVRTLDNVGNSSTIVKRQVTVYDAMTKNEIAISPAPSKEWENEPVDVTVTFSGDVEAAKGATKTYQVTNSATFPSTLTNTLPEDGQVTMSKDGQNYIHVRYEFDNGRTIVKSEGPYKIDKDATDSFNIWLEDENGTHTGWATEDLSIKMSSPTSSSISKEELQYRIEGYHGEWQTYSDDAVISIEGESKINGRLIDEAGNVSKTKTIIAQVDKTKPLVEFAKLTKNDDNTYDVEVTATDDVSGLSFIETDTGKELKTTSENNKYIIESVTGLPSSFTVNDIAGNTLNDDLAELPTVSFKDGYSPNLDIWKKDVQSVISGTGEVSYSLGLITEDCSTNTCDVSITDNTTFVVTNEIGTKTSSVETVIDNINQGQTRLILDGERNGDTIDLFWTPDITNGTMTCEYNGTSKSETNLSGDTATLQNVVNQTYKCTLTGTMDGESVTSNTITIRPDYAQELDNQPSDALGEKDIDKNIFIEESRVGKTYYINTQRDNIDLVPLPDEMYQ